MANKKTFEQAYHEFAVQHPGEADTLTPEQLAERTGYSLGAVRDYFRVQENRRRQRKQEEEEQQIRALEAGAVTFVTSSGAARVIYYPLLGEAKISSNHARNRHYPSNSWEDRDALLLSSQDTIEIGIYLLGLQPHIRDVLARKEKTALPAVEPDTSLPTDDDNE